MQWDRVNRETKKFDILYESTYSETESSVIAAPECGVSHFNGRQSYQVFQAMKKRNFLAGRISFLVSCLIELNT